MRPAADAMAAALESVAMNVPVVPVVANVLADRVAIMHRGEIVELDTPGKIFSAPKHEYTQLLLKSHLSLPGGELGKATVARGGGGTAEFAPT